MSTTLAQYKGPKVAQIIDATIPIGGNKIIEGIGDVFRLVTSDDQLMIRSNLSPKAAFTTKQGLRSDESNLFERLEIYNETAAPINFRLFFGFGDFLDGSSNILGTVSVSASALPAGASTGAKQDTGNASLAVIAASDDVLLSTRASEATLAVVSGKLPAGLDVNGRLKIGRNALGAQGNGWNAAATGAGGFSQPLDTLDAANVSVFGHVDNVTTLTVQVSEDSVTYYDTVTNVVTAGAADFHLNLFTGAKWVRLKSSANVTATATLSAK